MPAVDPVLDRSERSLVERTLAFLRGVRPRDSAQLWAQVKRIALLGEVLEQTPSLRVAATLGEATRDEASLVAELSQLDRMISDVMLPEKAIVARAFQMAKIGLLRGFMTALRPDAAGAAHALWKDVRDELGQSIYTVVAAEILIDLLCDGRVPQETRVRAAHQMVLLWDRAAQLEIDDFCPLLEAAWQARSRIAVRFGALLGVGEYLRLAHEDCPSEFLDFFTRDEVSEEEVQAFDEFLFNLPHEDLARLREAMKRENRKVIDLSFASATLGRPIDEAAAVDDPEALYRSYRRRSNAAAYRCETGAPGPRRVAEAYIMMYVLDARVG
jgi:hypothetical protein